MAFKKRNISSGNDLRECRHSASHWVWLRIWSIKAHSLAFNRFLISKKCMKMRIRTFGLREGGKQCVDIVY